MKSSIHTALSGTAAVAVLCLTAGCSDLAGGDAAAVYEMAKGLWSGGSKVTLQDAAAIPYASIGVSLGGGPQVMLVLATDSGGERLWTSAARVAITTDRNGRIIRTSGLGHDLSGYAPEGDTVSPSGERVLHWQADFPDLGVFGVSITCEERPAVDDTIVILGKEIQTQRIEEKCVGRQLGWKFKNTYWKDPDSDFAWRSIQHVNPKLDAIETETLRPPA